MARAVKQNVILLHLDLEQLADLLHLPEDLTPLSIELDSLTRSVQIVLETPDADRRLGRGCVPPIFTWEGIIARKFER